MKKNSYFSTTFIILLALSLSAQPVRQAETVKPTVLRTIPHDPEAFTQGLVCIDSTLYESTGIVGQSSLRKIDAESGKVLTIIPVPDLFGEGLAFKNGELVQLTWKAGLAIRYQFPSLKPGGVYKYSGQGWGLTSNDSHFIMSNGSDTLYYRNDQFSIEKTVAVTLNGKPLKNLNELEFVDNRIYANIWFRNFIAEISTEGKVTRIIDCSELVNRENPPDPNHVLNGVAYCENRDVWYLTGKNWKSIYVVKIPKP
ncbi:MAG: glutaminyl-peptide cyclotransferase [Chitinispirillaceae bacterium]